MSLHEEAIQQVQRLQAEREDLAIFVKRLVRKCYTLGHRSKLTNDAMDYINKIGAKCSPETALLNKIFRTKSAPPTSETP